MSKCKACGREIIWAVNEETGKRVPLDMVAPVYYVVEREQGGPECIRAPARTYVSHFSTCPDANKFSAFRRKS